MRIGIAYDLKPHGPAPADAPDDIFEEFDAPETVDAIAVALQKLGHEIERLGDGRELLFKLLDDPPDLVFNFAEGTGTSRSREARVPAVCEMLGIPYTGSDPLAMAVALDKDLTRRLVEPLGVRVPKGLVFPPPPAEYDGDCAEFPAILAEAGLALPVIAKPTFEGSSKGVRNRCLIRTPAEFGPTVVELWHGYKQPVLVEEFIAGDEVTVGVLGNDPPEVFGVMKITPKTPTEQFVYSLEVKRDFRAMVDYHCPSGLPADVVQDIAVQALTAFEALGCRDVARIDFRVRAGVAYFLELNPLPGLNPGVSDLVIMADLLGVTHAELIGRIVAAAGERMRIA